MVLSISVVGQSDKIDLAEQVFATKFNESLIHQVVTAYRAAGRAGTCAQKTRAEVSGGGKKPWKQKGTGQARAGTTRGPIWRGGGVTFASKTRDYTQKVNKKMYKGAMRSIFGGLYRDERLVLIKDLVMETNKTKDLLKKLKELNLSKVLLVTEEVHENLYLAGRNIPNVQLMDAQGINPVDLLRYDKVLMTVGALHKVEEMLS